MKHLTYFALMAILLFGCNSDATDPPDGDTDASELELETETDSGEIDTTDTSSDGDESDADSEAVEDELPDGDDDLDAVEDELDSDSIDNDVVEMEEVIEVEQVVYPPTVIETLPYDELTVTACEQKTYDDNLPAASESNRLVWGDDDGLMYFVDRSYLGSKKSNANFVWIYNKAEKTFTCDLALSQTAFAMDGLNTDAGTVIWLAQKNRLAKRKPTGEWLYFDIPDAPMPDGYDIAGGIQVDNFGWVAVWGRWGIVFYNENADTWKKFDLPAFVDQPVVLHGSWHENKFYLPAGCKVLSWEIGTDSLIEEATIDGCDETAGDGLYVIDKTDNNLKMAQVNWKKEQSTYGRVSRIVVQEFSVGVLNDFGVIDPESCEYHLCRNPTAMHMIGHQTKATLHILPNMSGIPVATIVSAIGYVYGSGPSNGNRLNNYIRLGTDVDCEAGKCYCGKVWKTGFWNVPGIGGDDPSIDEWGNFSFHMWKMFTTSFWRDGETLWLGSTRVNQAAP